MAAHSIFKQLRLPVQLYNFACKLDFTCKTDNAIRIGVVQNENASRLSQISVIWKLELATAQTDTQIWNGRKIDVESLTLKTIAGALTPKQIVGIIMFIFLIAASAFGASKFLNVNESQGKINQQNVEISQLKGQVEEQKRSIDTLTRETSNLKDGLQTAEQENFHLNRKSRFLGLLTLMASSSIPSAYTSKKEIYDEMLLLLNEMQADNQVVIHSAGNNALRLVEFVKTGEVWSIPNSP